MSRLGTAAFAVHRGGGKFEDMAEQLRREFADRNKGVPVSEEGGQGICGL